MAPSLGFYGDGFIFWVVANQSFWPRVLLGDARIAQARWTPVRRILGGDRTCGVSFNFSSGWWWFVSSMFLTRTSCCEITCRWLLECLVRVGGFSVLTLTTWRLSQLLNSA